MKERKKRKPRKDTAKESLVRSILHLQNSQGIRSGHFKELIKFRTSSLEYMKTKLEKK